MPEVMMDRSADFGPFDGHTYLNSASQGAMPRSAVEQAHKAVDLKAQPFRIDSALFASVPRNLRQALGRLLNASVDDLILGNSTSYGLHLLANGIRWRAGDEVLVVEGDYPACTYPWLPMQKQGVRVRPIRPQGTFLDPDELRNHLTPDTRLFCTNWVHSFLGHAVNVDALGKVCKENGVIFVLNASQAIGARLFDASTTSADAVTSCGFKWLLGPYGTGFLWLKPELRDSLEYGQSYWYTMKSDEDGQTASGTRYAIRQDLQYWVRDDLPAGARYDVFNPANFYNFIPWTACLDYLLQIGLDKIAIHNASLVAMLVDSLPQAYRLVSPHYGPDRSTLVVLEHRISERTGDVFKALSEAFIDVTFRGNQLRISPHLNNNSDDIIKALSVLDRSA